MWVSMYVSVCWEKRNQVTSPGETDWGSYPMLFMKESCPPLSDLSISLLSSSLSLLLYIPLFLFSHIESPLQHTPLYFIHLALRIFSQNLSGFHFELVLLPPPPPPHSLSSSLSLSLPLSFCACPRHSRWNWNSCLTAKTGVSSHDLSLVPKKDHSQKSPGIGSCRFLDD